MKKFNIKSYIFGVVSTLLIVTLTLGVFAGPITKTITATFGSTKYVVNGVQLDKDSLVYDGTAYYPSAYLAQKLGYKTSYDKTTNTTTITGTSYYQENRNVPDFGSLFGIKSVDSYTVDDSEFSDYEYDYSLNDLSGVDYMKGYDKLLKNEGFKFDKEDSDEIYTVYTKGTTIVVIGIYDNDTLGIYFTV